MTIAAAARKKQSRKGDGIAFGEVIWRGTAFLDGTALALTRTIGKGQAEGEETIAAELPRGNHSKIELAKVVSEAIGFKVRFQCFVDQGSKATTVVVLFKRADQPARVRGQKRPTSADPPAAAAAAGSGDVACPQCGEAYATALGGCPDCGAAESAGKILGDASQWKAAMLTPPAAAAESNGQGPAAPPPAPPAPVYEELPLAAITPSPLNPRKHFDEVELQGLAASIREHGVLQPIVVRSLRVDVERGPLKGRHESYELLAGERRWRASKMAGRPKIPCIVHLQMSDLQADEIRLTENLQRADLDPLEEAAGYARMLSAHGYTVDRLAEKLGKSKGYVYGVLKLDELPDKAKAALAKGDIPKTTAQLIARLPTAGSKDQVTKFALEKFWNGKLPGFREVKEHIEERWMIELKQAPFPTKDAGLTGAGACTVCPKRTGNNRDLYPDARADICTDPACYQDKVKAHVEREAAAVQAEGAKLLTRDEAAKVFVPGEGRIKYNASFVDLADTTWVNGKQKSYQQIFGGQVKGQIVLAHDDAGTLHRLVPKSVTDPILRKVDPGGHSASAERSRREDAARAKKAQAGKEAARRANGLIAAAAAHLPETIRNSPVKALVMLRSLAVLMGEITWADACKQVTKRRQVDDVAKLVEGMDDAGEVFGLIVELVAAKHSLDWGHPYHDGARAKDPFWTTWGIDPAKLIKEVMAEQAAAKKGKGK